MKHLGRYLLEMGAISEDQLQDALRRQRLSGAPLGEVLRDGGEVGASTLELGLALQGRDRARHLSIVDAMHQARELARHSPLGLELPLACLGLGALAGVLSFPIIFYFYSGWAWEIISVSTDLPGILRISAATVLLLVVALGFEAFAGHIGVKAGAIMLQSASVRLHRSLLRRSMRRVDTDVGDVAMSLYAQNIEQFAWHMQNFLIRFPKAVASLLAFFTILLLSHAGIALLILVLTPFTLILPPLVAAHAQPFLRREVGLLGESMGRIEPFFRFFRTSGGVLLERAVARLAPLLRPHHLNQASKWFYWNTSFNVRSFFNLLTLSSLLVYGGWKVLHGDMSTATLFSLFLAASLILPRFNDIYECYFDLHTAGHHAALINEQLRLPVVEDSHETPGRPVQGLALRIQRFAYGEQELFRDLRLDFLPGRLYLLCGPSGAGKSTLARLLAGILEAPEVDVDIAYADGSRSGKPLGHIAYIGQEHLFLERLDLAGNVACQTEPDAATRGRVEEGLRRFGLTGLDPASTTTQGFSGGERQRLHLLQGLLAAQKIRIFDEPTASLDAHSAGWVKEALSQVPADEIRIVISHDPQWPVPSSQRILLEAQHP